MLCINLRITFSFVEEEMEGQETVGWALLVIAVRIEMLVPSC